MDEQLIAVIKNELKETLPDKRFSHTTGVAYTAASLAMCHGCDIQDALIAGLLHDCAKYLDDDRMIEICRQHGIEVREVELRNPFLLHGKAGAVLAEEKYGVHNKSILNAITYHTTGRPEMNLMEEIIFTADFIEPGRKEIEGLEKVRRMAFENLNQAVKEILRLTIQYLKNDGSREMDQMTVETYQYYKNLGRRI